MRMPDLNDLIQDLQLAKDIAIKNEQPNSLVTAVMAQAKLLGLDSGLKDVTPDDDIKSGLGWFYGETDTLQVTRVIVDPVANTKESY